MPLMAVQLLSGRAGLVVANVPKTAPGALVKVNWNEPLLSFAGVTSVGAVGVGRTTLTTPAGPGIPFTKTVARA